MVNLYVEASLIFGAALSTLENEPLRDHLRTRLGNHPAADTISVDTLFALADEPAGESTRRVDHAPSYFVILDLQRVILFRRCFRRGEPDVGSLVRHLIDGYPLQPFDDFAEAERGRPHKFCFDHAVLDLVPYCLHELAPGEYAVLDLVSGEVSTGRLHPHPSAVERPRVVAPREPEKSLQLRRVVTNRGMRTGPPPTLDEFVERHAGIIRSENVQASSASFAFAATSLTWNQGRRIEYCYGRAFSATQALHVARCEALERFQVAKQPPGVELVRASFREVAQSAVDPSDLFFGRSPVCPEDEGEVFDPRAQICWTWAWNLGDARWRLVPAQEIWFNTPELMSEPRMVYATTSGCAAGATLEEAAVFAVFEAIERDALLTSWYLQRPAVEIDLHSFHSEQLNDLLGRLRIAAPAYRPLLIDVTSDVGVPTVVGLLVREEGHGPRVRVASACDIDAEKACFLALKDLSALLPDMTLERVEKLRQRTIVPPTPIAHSEFYALDENFSAFDYLELGRRSPIAVQEVGQNTPVPPQGELKLDVLLASLAQRLRSTGADLLLKDITHPGLCRELRVARAITPGLYPIWFGGRNRRFAVTDRLRHLAQSYTGRPFNPDRLQLAPHPLP